MMRSIYANVRATVRQLTAMLLASALFVPSLRAHDHVLGLAELHSALNQASGLRAANQQTLDRFMSQSRVKSVLKRAGVDASSLRGAALLLSDEEQSSLAARVRAAESDLSAGEMTLTDSQVTLIILAVTGFAYLTVLVLAFK